MGAIEDTRKLTQDFLAPELRAIAARFDSLDKGFDRFEKQMDDRFSHVEQQIEQSAKQVEKLAEDRYIALQLSLASLTNYNELRERMLHLEREALRRKELDLDKQPIHQ